MYCTRSYLSALLAYLFTYILPACLFTSCLLQLSIVSCLLYCLYCFTTCTDLLQHLGVWYSSSQLLFTCLPVFQLCVLALSFVLNHLSCGGRSGGVARAWWEDGSLALQDFFSAVWVFLPSAVGQPVSLVFLLPPAWGFAYGRVVALSYISSTVQSFVQLQTCVVAACVVSCHGRCWPLLSALCSC